MLVDWKWACLDVLPCYELQPVPSANVQTVLGRGEDYIAEPSQYNSGTTVTQPKCFPQAHVYHGKYSAVHSSTTSPHFTISAFMANTIWLYSPVERHLFEDGQ